MTPEPIELQYTLQPLPAGRMPFRRWRWELWRGPALLAAGWRVHPLHAQRAVRTYCSRIAHHTHGIHALRPDITIAPESDWRGRAVTVTCGDLVVLLTPRAGDEAQLQPAPS